MNWSSSHFYFINQLGFHFLLYGAINTKLEEISNSPGLQTHEYHQILVLSSPERGGFKRSIWQWGRCKEEIISLLCTKSSHSKEGLLSPPSVLPPPHFNGMESLYWLNRFLPPFSLHRAPVTHSSKPHICLVHVQLLVPFLPFSSTFPSDAWMPSRSVD